MAFGVSFLGFGLFSYFVPGTEISHFRITALSGTSATNALKDLSIIGQYKTVGRGFYVGKRISISALVHASDDAVYEQLKNWMLHRQFINNAEDPESYSKDVAEEIISHNIKGTIVNPGTVVMTNFDDNRHLYELRGDVVFTKEGVLSFGLPLSFILGDPQVSAPEVAINIGPSSVRDQIESNRIILLLAWVSACLALLTLRQALVTGPA